MNYFGCVVLEYDGKPILQDGLHDSFELTMTAFHLDSNVDLLDHICFGTTTLNSKV